MSVPDRYARCLAAALDGLADEARRAWWERYLKGTARFRGVAMADIRSVVRAQWTHELSTLPLDIQIAVAHRWFASDMSEDKLAAVLLFAEHLAPFLALEHERALAYPFERGDIADWGVCDWYSTKSLRAYICARPSEFEPRARAIAAWSRAPRLWQRRASVVAFVDIAAKLREPFPGFTDLLLDACAANLVSDERFAHTGPGWLLRELSRVASERVARFVADHPQLSQEARRMATARLRPGPYRRR